MLPKEITGQRFGKLLVISRAQNSRFGTTRWNVLCDCGTQKVVNGRDMRGRGTKSCGCIKKETSAANVRKAIASRVKSGRYKNGAGYSLVYAPGHPNAQKGGFVLEHRLVMEKSIGRYLLKEENVHHINGIKDDNRIENLELWSVSQPSGQRVEDLLSWAKQIIALYGE